ncbi:MAG: hypothetical protein LBE04_03910 [Prevotellaceae bacterium]|jgi:hypothetical protein|nr:hypothetical protein [Prevotellaceae bacterium]
MKRIFLISGLAIAIGFAVANVGVTKQDIKMSVFLENVIALTTENNGAIDLGRCFMTVTEKRFTGIYVQKCVSGTSYTTIYPCNNAILIQSAENFYADPRLCYSESANS